MEYVLAVLVLALIVAGAVTAARLAAARRRRDAAAADRDYGAGTPGSDLAILTADENTPLGDTDQHAGEQTREGTTVGAQDAEHSGGTGRAATGGYAGTGAIGDSERGRRDDERGDRGDQAAGGMGGLGGEGEGSRPVKHG